MVDPRLSPRKHVYVHVPVCVSVCMHVSVCMVNSSQSVYEKRNAAPVYYWHAQVKDPKKRTLPRQNITETHYYKLAG